MPRWLAALFAVFCLACTGLASEPAMAERAGERLQAYQSIDVEAASASAATGSLGDADASDAASDLPDLISTPLPAAVPVKAVSTSLDGRCTLLPSPPLARLQRPPSSGTISA